MKTISTRNTVLALVGLLALTVYILACTSFSPNDKQVLYPTFDETGVLGMAVYDRETKHQQTLFAPVIYSGESTNAVSSILNGQWLAGGKHVLVEWACTEHPLDDQLNLAVVPVGERGAVRTYTLVGIDEPGTLLMHSLPVVGDRVFVMVSDHTLARLDLKSGAVVPHEFEGQEGQLALYPGHDSQHVFYLLSSGTTNIFGRLDPERFSLTALVTITNEVSDNSFFTYDRQGSRIAFVEEGPAKALNLILLKDGKTELRKPLGSTAGNIAFGNGIISPGGEKLWASFQRASAESGKSDFGLMEIPLNTTGSLKQMVLIHDLAETDDTMAMYFQVGISHDGKMAAMASTYLGVDKKPGEFEPQNCALFLVDISSPQWKVTKVPIPVPVTRVNVGK